LGRSMEIWPKSLIFLSGDERRGDRVGPDETIHINGAHWNDIQRILFYAYIYKGAENWAHVRPQIQVRVPHQSPMIVTLNASKQALSLCAIASLENVRGGLKLTSILEYFPGHAEMDRAFGFGLSWEDGVKI
jgi:tellurite resistance protein TerA